MQAFTFNTTPSIVFEAGSAKRFGAIAGKRLGPTVLFVTDPGLRKLGLCDAAIASLESVGASVGACRKFSWLTACLSIYTSHWDSDNFWKNVTLQLRLLRPESQLRCNVSLAMRMLPLFPKRASRIRCFHR